MVSASGVRISWPDLPQDVRDAVEAIAGGPVAEASSQPGGFSPGTADRIVLTDGRRAFVKAVSREQNPQSVELHRAEARVTAALPAGVPAPRLLGYHDDGTWVALVFEDVDGRQPHVPWQDDELAAVLAALRRLAVPARGLPELQTVLAEPFAGWRRIAADPPASLDPWIASNLDLLVELADRGTEAVTGDRLVHVDIRADNLLIRADGSVAVVDWPSAAVGVAWFDTLSLLLNVRLYGGEVSDDALAVFDPDEGDVTAVLAGLTAYFTDRARDPDPPGLPTVRRFQRDQADVILPWLRDRLAAGRY